MQELISQIAALGIEITPTRSLMIIFGIIGNAANLLI